MANQTAHPLTEFRCRGEVLADLLYDPERNDPMTVNVERPPLNLDQQTALYGAVVIIYDALRTPNEYGNERGSNVNGALSALLNAGWKLTAPNGTEVFHSNDPETIEGELLAWAADTIRDTNLVTDPAVCERLEAIDRLLGREDDD